MGFAQSFECTLSPPWHSYLVGQGVFIPLERTLPVSPEATLRSPAVHGSLRLPACRCSHCGRPGRT